MDAGWFLDAPNYLGSGFTFTMLSKLLKTTYGAKYDKYARCPCTAAWVKQACLAECRALDMSRLCDLLQKQ